MFHKPKWIRAFAQEARDQLEQLASVLEAELINRCGSFLEDHILANRRYSGPPRLLHADFSAEHILLSSDGRQVVGVIDWTDAEIGDPAFDFGYLWVCQPHVSVVHYSD